MSAAKVAKAFGGFVLGFFIWLFVGVAIDLDFDLTLLLGFFFGVLFAWAATYEPPVRKVWAAIKIGSDPPEAHVYGEGGKYWGQTSEGIYVQHALSLDQTEPTSQWYTITLKRRGYRTTTHDINLEFKYKTREEAIQNAEKLVVVIEPGVEDVGISYDEELL